MRNPDDSIREYQPHDLPAVEQCLAELQDFSKLICPSIADGTIAPRYLQHLLTRCAKTNGKLFVAVSNGRVAGMVCVLAKVRSDAVDEEPNEYAHVTDLVILTNHRNHGLGRALLDRAEKYARDQGATLLRIHVLAQNEAARSLYLSFGFEERWVGLQKRL